MSTEKYEMVQSIRALFLGVKDELVEDIKYGGVVYLADKTLVGGIFVYKNHISIEFSNGAQLPDPSGVLEGNGKLRRHIKIINNR